MKRKTKSITAVVLAAVMCISLTGCKTKEQKAMEALENFGNELNKDFNNTSKKTPITPTQSKPAATTSSQTSSQTSESEAFKLVVSDEIKNANLGSGKVQMNNDIFRESGYMTVADFAAKYKDTYDITYKDAPYAERLDYLLEYSKSDDSTNYHLELKPKITGAESILVYIGNRTSPDEKITIDKGIILESGYSNSFEIYPGGFMNQYRPKNDVENINERYNVKTLPEYLKEQGFTFWEDPNPDDWFASHEPNITSTDEKLYWKYGSGYKCCVFGEMSLTGKYPLYYYTFNFNSDTDKLDYVTRDVKYATPTEPTTSSADSSDSQTSTDANAASSN